ncbi:MAG: hypothetical protein HY815_26855 [Candidatus Riflebacteria bacterium]|nr:hypothetical protein [Candidatus Riflebacteria bacterium]
MRKLDGVDALAAHLGLPEPYRVRDALAPVVATAVSRSATPVPPGFVVFPPPGRPGLVLYHPMQALDRGGTAADTVGDVLTTSASDRISSRERGSRLAFGLSPRAGKGGRRLHILVADMEPHFYLELSLPGVEEALPVRLPPGWVPPKAFQVWLTVTIRGPLARGEGRCTVTHGRAFDGYSRPFVVVDRIVDEAMP